jgi:Fe2+ or Zn2+ uptake regulation protein
LACSKDYNETVATKVAIQKLWKKRFYNQAIKLCSLPEFSDRFLEKHTPMNSVSNSVSNSASISNKIRAAFAEKGRRKTQARERIATRLAELAASGQDFSVEELWHDLQQVDASLGRATVFRAVEMLVNMGLLNRIEFADGSHTYRACGDEHHHHLTCRKCHRVVDVEICIPDDQLVEIGKQTGFEIEGHSLVLFGVCADCRK